MTLIPAGASWCERFPTSKTTASLVQPFRKNVQRFITELERRGCTVTINATRRPEQRAWLMRQAWDIVFRDLNPSKVEVRADIPISWTLRGAQEMVVTYDLAYRPSLTSRHIDGRAVDLEIDGWKGSDQELWDLGASFGVHKLIEDRPHWSDDGK